MCLIASNCQDARPCLAVDGPSALRHHGWDGGASRAATRTSSASAVSSWSARAHGALTAFLVHCRMPCVSSGLEVPDRRAAARMRIPALWNFSVNGSTPPWKPTCKRMLPAATVLNLLAACFIMTLTRAIVVPLPCRSSRFSIRRALATLSISTRSSRRAAHDGPQRACVPCARSSRDPRCCTCSRCRVSGCTHRIRAPPGHGYDVLCVACAFACVFMIPMRKICQKLGRVVHKTMILRAALERLVDL